MLSFSNLLSTVSLAAVVSASAIQNVPSVLTRGAATPASGAAWNPTKFVANATAKTDFSTIQRTASIINQKSGAVGVPNQSIAAVSLTANDASILQTPTTINTTYVRRDLEDRDVEQPSRRAVTDYNQIFAGKGTGSSAPNDGSIVGTAYLTYTTVANSTYNVNACLNWCSTITGCTFVNLYYELNNPILNAGSSNLKCVAYADSHSADEKVTPSGSIVIKNSGGWALNTIANPATPAAYSLVFGPTSAANSAPGYMASYFLTRYDTLACAALCNAQPAHSTGGDCQYFNIWRATLFSIPVTYVCSLYYVPTDASTATNAGGSGIAVTWSRGYKRKNFVVDGGFEGYAACSSFCYTASYTNWIGTSPTGGTLDASIFYFATYSRTGHSVGLLGSANNDDALPGTLTPAVPLATTAGKKYRIGFYHASSFSGPDLAGPAFVNVKWNGATVKAITPGYEDYTYYQATVTAVGNDVLAFNGGKAPAWSFLDDIAVYQL